MLKHVVKRVLFTGAHVAIATPPEDKDEIGGAVPELLREWGVTLEAPDCHPEDVLKRHLMVAQRNGWDAVMRVTSDCPLIDPFSCNEVLNIYMSRHYDYVANDIANTYPNGMGCEIMSVRALVWANYSATTAFEREHVSPWIRDNLRSGKKGMFDSANVVCPFPGVRGIKFSVDTQADLDCVIAIDQAKPADYSLGATREAYDRAFPT